MNIIINTNNLLTAGMLEKYLLRHSLQTRVEAVGPLDPALAGMDVAIYFAEDISTVPLIEFLQKAEGSSPFVKKMLFAKTEHAALFGSELQGLFDEVVGLPVNAAVLVEKLTLLCPHAARAAHAAPQAEPPAAAPPPEEPPVKPIVTAHSYTLDNLAAQSTPAETDDPYAGLAVSRPITSAQPIQPIQPNQPNTPADSDGPTASANAPGAASAPAAGASAPVMDIDEVLHPAPATVSPAAPAIPATASEPTAPTAKKAAQAQTETGKVKPRGFKKALSIAGKVLSALMLVLVLMMILLVVNSRRNRESPSILGYQYYVVYTGSMKGTNPDSFDQGSLILVKKIDPAQVTIGDIITFDRADEDAKLTTHRVIKITKDAKGKLIFTTKGDANAGPDDAVVPQAIVKGIVVKSVPKLGKFILFAQTKAGMIYFVYVPAGAIVLYEIYVFSGDWYARKKAKGKPGGGSG